MRDTLIIIELLAMYWPAIIHFSRRFNIVDSVVNLLTNALAAAETELRKGKVRVLEKTLWLEVVGVGVHLLVHRDSPVATNDSRALGNVVAHVFIIGGDGVRHTTREHWAPAVDLLDERGQIRHLLGILEGGETVTADNAVDLALEDLDLVLVQHSGEREDLERHGGSVGAGLVGVADDVRQLGIGEGLVLLHGEDILAPVVACTLSGGVTDHFEEVALLVAEEVSNLFPRLHEARQLVQEGQRVDNPIGNKGHI